MLQRIWAAMAALWAVMAVFMVLALRQAPVAPSTAMSTTTTTAHAVTSSSTVATRPSNGASATPVAAVTRSS